MTTPQGWTVVTAKPTPAAIAAGFIEQLKPRENNKAIEVGDLLPLFTAVGTTIEGGYNISRMLKVLEALIEMQDTKDTEFAIRTVACMLPAGRYTLSVNVLAKLAELGITHITGTNTTPLPAPVVKKLSSDGASSGPAIGSAENFMIEALVLLQGTFDLHMVAKGPGSKGKSFKDEFPEYGTFTVPINPTVSTGVKMILTIVKAMNTIYGKDYREYNQSTINFGNSVLKKAGTRNPNKPDLAKIFVLVTIGGKRMLLPVCMEMISRNRNKIKEGMSLDELFKLIVACEFTPAADPVDRPCFLGEFCHNSLCEGDHYVKRDRVEIDGCGLSAVGCIRASCIRASRLRAEAPDGEILPLNDLVGVEFPADPKGTLQMHGALLRIASN